MFFADKVYIFAFRKCIISCNKWQDEEEEQCQTQIANGCCRDTECSRTDFDLNFAMLTIAMTLKKRVVLVN
jgi:hypothetical protein